MPAPLRAGRPDGQLNLNLRLPRVSVAGCEESLFGWVRVSGGGGFIPARPPRTQRHPRLSHAEQSMEAADYEVLSVREQLFHERVRECIVSAGPGQER